MNNLDNILKNLNLNEELKLAIQDSWNEKTKEIESKIRKELSERYEVDKMRIVESMEKFLTDNLQKQIEDINKAKKTLYEENKKIKDDLMDDLRKNLEKLKDEKKKIEERKKAVVDNLKNMRNKMVEDYHEKMDKFIDFVNNKLTDEIRELRLDLKNIEKEKREMQNELRNARLEYKKAYEDRIKKIENFLVKQLTEELIEFNKDKKLLESRRVELEITASKKINEARRMFIEKATKLIESIVSEEMTKELRQLKEDITLAKQNDFGRRIFESFVSEFMSSHLMENSEISKMKKKLDENFKLINSLKEQLYETKESLIKAKKDSQLLREEMERERILSDLLMPLSPKQRKVMTNLLEGVKKENLATQFKKYLPSVIDDISLKTNSVRTVVSESTDPVSTVVTGDRLSKKLDNQEKIEEISSVIELKKLAGIN